MASGPPLGLQGFLLLAAAATAGPGDPMPQCRQAGRGASGGESTCACHSCGHSSSSRSIESKCVQISKTSVWRRRSMPIAGDVELGSDVVIYHPELVNLYGCVIGAKTSIG